MAKLNTQEKLAELNNLGWQSFFENQLNETEISQSPLARVTQIHRNSVHVLGDQIDTTVIFPDEDITVGDWVLLDEGLTKPVKILTRKSLLKRRAAGHDRQIQLIAANLDTAFLVTSCNRDFNIARLERYVALAFDAGVTPVIVLSKADLCKDVAPFEQAAKALSKDVDVVVLNALDQHVVDVLKPWCGQGKTVGFLGSSGVGKSTLVNALTGAQSQTQDVRAIDARGRHTTTYRHLHISPQGCAVLDTPGMRELQLMDASEGLNALFPDLYELTLACKFSDCSHLVEPGCAVLAALKRNEIDPQRVERWRKLMEEEQQNTQDMARKKQKERRFGSRTKARYK